jgi:predicted transcriptional regulator
MKAQRDFITQRADTLSFIIERGPEGAGPTNIMYGTNLSWPVLQGHLDKLEKIGAATSVTVGRRVRFFSTKKGKKLLSRYKKALLSYMQTRKELSGNGQETGDRI